MSQLIAGALPAVAVLLTPVAGVCIWLAIGLGPWAAVKCRDLVEGETLR
ncbi:MAG: hypothetical protein JNL96_18235 [Planctomycetaceae bacterium]|nr:hypothetical protein [Planctomycetaceae bacterium]